MFARKKGEGAVYWDICVQECVCMLRQWKSNALEYVRKNKLSINECAFK